MSNYEGNLIGQKLDNHKNYFYVVDERDGLSAYEIAVANGFVGTEEQWLASLANTGTFYQHIQSSASVSWVINHNLGFNPSITVFDGSGNQLYGEIIHHSTIQAEVQFNSVQTGTANCS